MTRSNRAKRECDIGEVRQYKTLSMEFLIPTVRLWWSKKR